MFEQVHEVKYISFNEIAEINDDVITLCNRLGGQDSHFSSKRAIEGHGVLHYVSIITDHMERNWSSVLFDQSDLHVTRDGSIEDSEAILSRSHIHVRLVLPVGENPVAHETIEVERVEPELAFFVPCFVGEYQVHIVVAVSPVQCCAAGEPEIRFINQAFIATIE